MRRSDTTGLGLAAEFFPNGIDAESGLPLPNIDENDVRRIAVSLSAGGKVELRAAAQRFEYETFGVNRGEVDDPEDLSQTGWGVVFPSSVDASSLKAALAPLLDHRAAQAGARYKIFEGETGVRLGESATGWLARQPKKPGLAPVDPSRGVPFYLLLVGSPEEIPMSFQYMLDIFWAVGRLHFDTLEEYASYARNLVDQETSGKPLPKRAVIFAPEHPFDAATKMFNREVALPFVQGEDGSQPLGAKQKFELEPLLGDAATKSRLLAALSGGAEGPPALVFSGGHGMSFRLDDPRQEACQGALICQDWQGYGKISESDWFSATDLPDDLRLDGMIHFLFACYGGGWEKFDTFREGENNQPKQISKRPAIARLPRAMLSRGALAVLAHVDRAWSYSFRTPDGGRQTSGMSDVLSCLMRGMRIGNALDQFNVQWAALAVPISDALRDLSAENAPGPELTKLWIARDDARNYTVLGDPAVRLRLA